jgi:hypothetical protein
MCNNLPTADIGMDIAKYEWTNNVTVKKLRGILLQRSN